MKHFSPHVNGLFVNKLLIKNSTKRTKIPNLSQSQFSQKILPTDKAGVMKVSWKITTQHRQLIFHKIFKKDNTKLN